MTALLEVRDLQVRFEMLGPVKAWLTGAHERFVEAVAGVSFEVEAGRSFAIVGESGSGKSTLARTIMGLVPATRGSILFEGSEPHRSGRRTLATFRRSVSLMFQDPAASLSPRLTVRSLITEPFAIHGLKPNDLDAEARRLLKLVGLPADFASRYPHQLSGGQARRVGIARALALSPKLIIADEPTAGLDVSVQGEILNLLARLKRELGLTLIMITHNLAVVRHVSDEVAVMYMGRMVERGSTGAVFSSPAHPYTHALLAAQPYPDPDRRREGLELHGEVPSLLNRPSGCEFHTRCPRAQGPCSIVRPEPQRVSPDHEHRCHFPLISARPAGAASLATGRVEVL
jgi:oligopeptide/dipeptide ABC transporter ATP-binding protein